MIYLARRLDTGAVLEFEDDPDLVVELPHKFSLALPEGPVECEMVITVPEVIATDRRKRYDDQYRQVRSDGRFSDMSLPTRESCVAGGLPLAPHYNAQDEPSFMNKGQAIEYGKKLSDADPTGAVAFDG